VKGLLSGGMNIDRKERRVKEKREKKDYAFLINFDIFVFETR
jgi:hypothetical protein